jgi:hypothetical protein
MDAVSRQKLPLAILAGSDGRPGPVPAGAGDLHFVVGYKGAELRFGDRCLVQMLLDRSRASGVFGEVYVVGPKRVYGGLVDAPVIDSDGHIGENIRAAIERIQELHGRDVLLGIIACDILPEAEEIAALGGALIAAAGAGAPEHPGAALAISLIRAEERLGSSSWKPRYGVKPSPDQAPVPYLPGHLGLMRPSMLRMRFVYRLLSLLYHERNRDYDARQRAIVWRVVATLLAGDLRNLLRLQAPTLTYLILRHGLGTVLRWRRGDLDLEGLARGLAGVGVRRRHFRRWGASCVAVVTSDLLSFARDIDTREELEELVERMRR